MKCEAQYRVGEAWMALLVLVFLAWPNQASAQDPLPRRSAASETSLEVPLYKSRIIGLKAPAARVSVVKHRRPLSTLRRTTSSRRGS